MGAVCLVVPCFNEAARVQLDPLVELVADERISLVLVDDGSTDATAELLSEAAARSERISVLTMPRNVGKGEATRLGMLAAAESAPAWIGYLDADLATPPAELLRLLDIAVAGDRLDVVIGARVALLGRDIRRSPLRHYTGRVFATLASIVLAKPVYDTQCGAKLFRCGPPLLCALDAPFRSRWAFDVELLGRLAVAGVEPEAFWEEPLRRWHDIGGSRRSIRSSVRSTLDLAAVRRDLRARSR